MAKCEACEKTDGVEEVLDGSGMVHQLCGEHRAPTPPTAAPAPEASAPPHDEPREGDERWAQFERRLRTLEECAAKASSPPAPSAPPPAPASGSAPPPPDTRGTD